MKKDGKEDAFNKILASNNISTNNLDYFLNRKK